MQFLESEEYGMFSRIVFDTAPTVRMVLKFHFSTLMSYFQQIFYLLGPYSSTFVFARFFRRIHWQDFEGTSSQNFLFWKLTSEIIQTLYCSNHLLSVLILVWQHEFFYPYRYHIRNNATYYGPMAVSLEFRVENVICASSVPFIFTFLFLLDHDWPS